MRSLRGPGGLGVARVLAFANALFGRMYSQDGLRSVPIPPARINQLEQDRTRLSSQLEGLTHALSALKGTSGNGTRKGISTAGRARIAAAQRARWAKTKGTESRFNRDPQTQNLCFSPQENCRSTEGPVGKVAEGAENGGRLSGMLRPLLTGCCG